MFRMASRSGRRRRPISEPTHSLRSPSLRPPRSTVRSTTSLMLASTRRTSRRARSATNSSRSSIFCSHCSITQQQPRSWAPAARPWRRWVAAAEAELATLPEVRVLRRTICYAAFDHNFFGLVEGVTEHLAAPPAELPRKRLWKLRTKQVVYATGAIERPLVFADNDRPGVMTASAVQAYVNRYAVRPGRRAVVFTNNDGGYGAALDLKAAGVEVAAVVDARSAPAGLLTERAQTDGLRVIAGSAIVGVRGGKRVTGVHVARLSDDGKAVTGTPESIDCDLVANSGGWNPTVHLLCQAKGKLRWDDEHACFVPD